MPATKFFCLPGHNIGDLRCPEDAVCRLLLIGEGSVLGRLKPGYNRKLGKRARVLLPGQMTRKATQVLKLVF